MKVLVTGSSGHPGEALVRTLTGRGFDVLGLDIRKSAFTSVVGSTGYHDKVFEEGPYPV